MERNYTKKWGEIDIVAKKDTDRIELDCNVMEVWPGEIGLRVLIKAIDLLRGKRDYGPRFAKIEALFADLMDQKIFRKRTLGGVVFERNDENSHVILYCENAN